MRPLTAPEARPLARLPARAGRPPWAREESSRRSHAEARRRRHSGACPQSPIAPAVDLSSQVSAQLGNEGAQQLGAALAHYPSLTSLDLAHNNIGAEGAHGLAPLLRLGRSHDAGARRAWVGVDVGGGEARGASGGPTEWRAHGVAGPRSGGPTERPTDGRIARRGAGGGNGWGGRGGRCSERALVAAAALSCAPRGATCTHTRT